MRQFLPGHTQLARGTLHSDRQDHALRGARSALVVNLEVIAGLLNLVDFGPHHVDLMRLQILLELSQDLLSTACLEATFRS